MFKSVANVGKIFCSTSQRIRSSKNSALFRTHSTFASSEIKLVSKFTEPSLYSDFNIERFADLIKTDDDRRKIEAILEEYEVLSFGGDPASAITPEQMEKLISSKELDVVIEMIENGNDVYCPEIAPVISSVIQQTLKPSISKNRKKSQKSKELHVAKELQIPKEVLEKTIFTHPLFNQVNLTRIKENLIYLRARGDVSEDQILYGLCATLYDQSLLEEAIDSLSQWKDSDWWKSSFYFLQAVIYIIEKRNGFDGSAVFYSTKCDIPKKE